MQKDVTNVEFLRRRMDVSRACLIKDDRIVKKNGLRNIVERNIPQKTLLLFKDFVETMIEGQWRHTILVFVATYFCSWTFFAILYYTVAVAHGDLLFDKDGNRMGDDKEPCIIKAKSFTGFMLMSVESQVTTGYGEYYPSEECPEAMFVLIFQLTIGVVIDGTMIGIFYSKMIRPPKYADMKFGKKAVVCLRDGKLCLIFRLWDFRFAHDIKTRVRAYVFEEKTSKEGEYMGKVQRRLKIENRGRIFLFWPITVSHVIDSKSPLYNLSAQDVMRKKLEVVLTMTGVSQKTGQMRQARTSYLSREIMWGHRFVNVITYNYRKEKYEINEDLLDSVEQVDTPLCSAREIDEIRKNLEFLKRMEARPSISLFSAETVVEEEEEEELFECDHDHEIGLDLEATCSKYLDKEIRDNKLLTSEDLNLSAETV